MLWIVILILHNIIIHYKFIIHNYFQLHVGTNHWICISCNPYNSRPTIRVMDSLGLLMELNSTTILQISQLVNTNKNFFNVEKLAVQQQVGISDCGLFAIAFAVETCLMDNNVEMVYFNQLEMRNHLCICLEKGKITPFPKVKNSLNILTRSTHQTIKINVYCLCRLPDLYDHEMIQCDICKRWYHCKCVTVPEDVSSVFWQCMKCS